MWDYHLVNVPDVSGNRGTKYLIIVHNADMHNSPRLCRTLKLLRQEYDSSIESSQRMKRTSEVQYDVV